MKDCRVLINNEAVTVIDYDGKKVQLPSIHREAKTVKVISQNGKYTVVDENYKETIKQEIPEFSKRKTIKKTTVDEDVTKTEDYIEVDNA